MVIPLPTIKQNVNTTLNEMGQTPLSLEFHVIDLDSKPGKILVKGTFLKGYLGEITEFDAILDSESGNLIKCNIA